MRETRWNVCIGTHACTVMCKCVHMYMHVHVCVFCAHAHAQTCPYPHVNMCLTYTEHIHLYKCTCKTAAEGLGRKWKYNWYSNQKTWNVAMNTALPVNTSECYLASPQPSALRRVHTNRKKRVIKHDMVNIFVFMIPLTPSSGHLFVPVTAQCYEAL